MARVLPTGVVVLCLAIASWLPATPSFAQPSQNWTWCANQNRSFSSDLQIGGCTAVIQSGRETRTNLAIAFNNRGTAHAAKKDYDAALADYNQAIALDSKNPHPHHNRGLIQLEQKNYDQAIANFNEAIRLDTKYDTAYVSRGNAHFAKNEFDRAIANYDQAIRFNSKNENAFKNREAARVATDRRATPERDTALIPVNTSRFLDIFAEVFERARHDYVDHPNDAKLLSGAMHGLISVVGPTSFNSDSHCTGPLEAEPRTTALPTYRALSCFGDAFDYIRKEQAGRISDERLIIAAIDAMLAQLDPHSTYADAKTFRDQQVAARGEFGSIGVEIKLENGDVRVVALVDDNTPAAKAGILASDIISHIDNASLQGLTLDQVVEKLRGPLGSEFKIRIYRAGRPLEFVIRREVIRVRSVRSQNYEDIAYIRITQFNEQTTASLKKVLGDLNDRIPAKRPRGVILDLRNSSGGLLDQVISVSAMFLEKGKLLGTTVGRNASETQRFRAMDGDALSGKPLLVLINKDTGAGSEFVAGTLQDHNRATIVGVKSYGKGTIQTTIPLGSGMGAVRLTTSRYILPSGRPIEGIGITPEHIVEQEGQHTEDVQLQAALTYIRRTIHEPQILPHQLPEPQIPSGCPSEGSARSVRADEATNVVFRNHRKINVRLYWIDYRGSRKFYNELRPGQMYTQQTYMTHPWVVTDGADRCLLLYLPVRYGGTLDIR
jgi:carboxyl-terminal processing protease